MFLWTILTYKKNVSCNGKALLRSSVSHDPSEIILIGWLAAQETFLIINVEDGCAA